MDWFIFSIIATVLFGIQGFLYNSIKKNNSDKYLVTLVFMITVELLAIVFFIFNGITTTNLLITLFLGFLFALFFFLKTIGQLKALEHLPTNVVFPITSSSVILVIFYSLLFLNESLGIYQILGILLIILSINLIHHRSKKSKSHKIKQIGFLFAFLAILPGAAMTVTNKYASSSTDIGLFIVLAYLFSIIISYSSHKVSKNNLHQFDKKQSIKMGVIIGVVNFIGYICLLTAMKTGPLSLVASIHTTYIMVTVLLARGIHKEELSLKQLGLVILTILGIILLKI